MNWAKFNLQPALCKQLEFRNFHTPTEVQKMALQHLQDDMLIAAKTGEGKTLCYAIPITNGYLVDKANNSPAIQNSPYALILVPTRELAVQVEEHINAIAAPFDITTISIIGGLSEAKQKRILCKKKPQIVIATPGRLWDLLSKGDLPDGICEVGRARYVRGNFLGIIKSFLRKGTLFYVIRL